jgi:hypothetical protein
MISTKSCALIAAIVACLLLAVPSMTAQAKENAEFWPKVKVSGKTCFKSHQHYGESPPWPSKRGAKAAAIRKWESFTTWEYGKAWGRYSNATGRSLSCSQAKGRWICKTSARPCRRG